jgi:hypothetical protein
VLEVDRDPDDRVPSASERDKIRSFAPTLVLSTGGDPQWFDAIEPADATSHPAYVVTGLVPIEQVGAIVARDDAARRRFFSIDAPASTEGNVKFTLRFNDAFGPAMTVTPGTAPSVVYDPVYVAALATVAAGAHPLTGETIAEGIGHLVGPGPKIAVGPAQLYEAFDRLSRGESIDLEGAGSPLDFDVSTGEGHVRLAVYCLQKTRTGLDFVESGATYSVESRAIEGNPLCK